jgi:hypothetical protein
MKNNLETINKLIEENKRLKTENNIYKTQERIRKQDEQLAELKRSKEEKEFDITVKMNDYLAKLMATGLSHAAALERAMADPDFQILYRQYEQAYKEKSKAIVGGV